MFQYNDTSKYSRIDDLLTSANLRSMNTPATTILTGDLDHDSILAEISLTCTVYKPGPDPTPLPRESKMKTPALHKDLQNFKVEFLLQMGCP